MGFSSKVISLKAFSLVQGGSEFQTLAVKKLVNYHLSHSFFFLSVFDWILYGNHVPIRKTITKYNFSFLLSHNKLINLHVYKFYQCKPTLRTTIKYVILSYH